MEGRTDVARVAVRQATETERGNERLKKEVRLFYWPPLVFSGFFSSSQELNILLCCGCERRAQKKITVSKLKNRDDKIAACCLPHLYLVPFLPSPPPSVNDRSLCTRCATASTLPALYRGEDILRKSTIKRHESAKRNRWKTADVLPCDLQHSGRTNGGARGATFSLRTMWTMHTWH
jgi:hypothetical protein